MFGSMSLLRSLGICWVHTLQRCRPSGADRRLHDVNSAAVVSDSAAQRRTNADCSGAETFARTQASGFFIAQICANTFRCALVKARRGNFAIGIHSPHNARGIWPSSAARNTSSVTR